MAQWYIEPIVHLTTGVRAPKMSKPFCWDLHVFCRVDFSSMRPLHCMCTTFYAQLVTYIKYIHILTYTCIYLHLHAYTYIHMHILAGGGMSVLLWLGLRLPSLPVPVSSSCQLLQLAGSPTRSRPTWRGMEQPEPRTRLEREQSSQLERVKPSTIITGLMASPFLSPKCQLICYNMNV